MLVTTCPAGLSKTEAQRLLRSEGIPAPIDPLTSTAPDRIYGVVDGVPYEARPTLRSAATYHAFPMLPKDWKHLPDAVRAELETRARLQGERIGRWFNFVAKRIRELQE